MVEDISQLDRYPWCGHSVLIGFVKHSWQDTDYVLSWFDKRRGSALRAYRQFIKDGISLGRRPELVGGIPVQSEKNKGRQDSGYMEEPAVLDQRVLGDEDFVAKVKRELTNPEREKPLTPRTDQKRIQMIGACSGQA